MVPYIIRPIREISNNRWSYATIALSVFLVTIGIFPISVFVLTELNYDSSLTRTSSRFIVVRNSIINETDNRSYQVPILMGQDLTLFVPGIIRSARIDNFPTSMTVGTERYQQVVTFADSSLVDLLSLEVILSGGSQTRGIGVSSSVAEKLFGSPDAAIGKQVDFEIFRTTGSYQINYVYNLSQSNTNFPIELIFPYQEIGNYAPSHRTPSWRTYSPRLLVQIDSLANTADVEERLNELARANVDDRTLKRYELLSIRDMHFAQDIDGAFIRTGDATLLSTLVYSGGLLLVVGLFVFVAIAIGLEEKYRGSITVDIIHGRTIPGIYVSTVVKYTVLVAISIFISVLVFPVISNLRGFDLVISTFYGSKLGKYDVLMLSLLFGVFAIAVSIPSIYVSFTSRIISVPRSLSRHRGHFAQRIVVILLVFVSTTVMIVTFFIGRQVDYFTSYHPGYDVERVVWIRAAPGMFARDYVGIRDRLAQVSTVEAIAGSSQSFGFEESMFPSRITFESGDEINTNIIDAAGNFVDVFGLVLLSDSRDSVPREGVYFTQGVSSMLSTEYSESVSDFAVSSMFKFDKVPVLGYVQDIHYVSMRSAAPPLVLHLSDRAHVENIYVRVSDKSQSTLSEIAVLFSGLYGNYPFEISWLGEDLADRYESEQLLASLMSYASVLAILLAISGVYGMSLISNRYESQLSAIKRAYGAEWRHLYSERITNKLSLLIYGTIMATLVSSLIINKWRMQYISSVNFKFADVIVASGIIMIALLASSLYSWITSDKASIQAALSTR